MRPGKRLKGQRIFSLAPYFSFLAGCDHKGVWMRARGIMSPVYHGPDSRSQEVTPRTLGHQDAGPLSTGSGGVEDYAFLFFLRDSKI